ncbi:MAG: MBL fold metallo-hydrolase [Nitrospirota bacterium]
MLKKDGEYKFFIDALKKTEGKILARLIPDIAEVYNKEKKSHYFFPPFHLGYVNISTELTRTSDFNSIAQGGYYEMPLDRLEPFLRKKDKKVIGENIFVQHKKISPYEGKEKKSKEDAKEINEETASILNVRKKELENLSLYCFDVGQGDSLLLITSNGNPYIIDTNVSFGGRDGATIEHKMGAYVNTVKEILRDKGLDPNFIKGLFITHKHLDHIRGAARLFDEFNIENFLMNFDYDHPTVSVNALLEAVDRAGVRKININKPTTFADGETYISVLNPDSETSTNALAPDINDSSICLCVNYGATNAFLTGDAGCQILQSKYSCHSGYFPESVLKVSHHGSRTGTNIDTLNLLNPVHAFISAGTSEQYNHPHQETIECLANSIPERNIRISKRIKKNVCYNLNGDNIQVDEFFYSPVPEL